MEVVLLLSSVNATVMFDYEFCNESIERYGRLQPETGVETLTVDHLPLKYKIVSG